MNRETVSRILLLAFLLSAPIAFFLPMARAQTEPQAIDSGAAGGASSTQISGVAIDPSGAVVPGAKVRLVAGNGQQISETTHQRRILHRSDCIPFFGQAVAAQPPRRLQLDVQFKF